MFYLNWPVLMIFQYGTRQIVQLDSFSVTDSPLSVTNIAELAEFYLNWTVLMIIVTILNDFPPRGSTR